MSRACLTLCAIALGCNTILGIDELHPTATDTDVQASEEDAAALATAEGGPDATSLRVDTGLAGREPHPDAASRGVDATATDRGAPDTASADAPGAADAGDRVSSDAQVTPTEAGAEASSQCLSRTWPEPPTPELLPDSEAADVDFVVAMRNLDLGDLVGSTGPSYRTVGFDLDGRCTRQGVAPGSCRAPSWALAIEDGEDGIDNALGLFFSGARELLGRSPSESYNQLIELGVVSVLLRVRGYNGAPDDAQVELGFYAPGPRLSPTMRPVPPAWDGQDVWPIFEDSVERSEQVDGGTAPDIDRPVAVDPNAYVAGGILVADVPSASLRVPSPITEPPGQLVIRISGAVVVGRLTQTGDRWEIHDAVLAGRWPAAELLSQMSQLPSRVDNSGRTPLCKNVGDYDKTKRDFCSLVDILGGLGTANNPCDALSVGIRFDTGAARLGPLIPTPPFPPRCAPEHDPANDSCEGP